MYGRIAFCGLFFAMWQTPLGDYFWDERLSRLRCAQSAAVRVVLAVEPIAAAIVQPETVGCRPWRGVSGVDPKSQGSGRWRATCPSQSARRAGSQGSIRVSSPAGWMRLPATTSSIGQSITPLLNSFSARFAGPTTLSGWQSPGDLARFVGDVFGGTGIGGSALARTRVAPLAVASADDDWVCVLEAPTGIEPVVRILQTLALPLGHGAPRLSQAGQFNLCGAQGEI